jgi:hypothetical protein
MLAHCRKIRSQSSHAKEHVDEFAHLHECWLSDVPALSHVRIQYGWHNGTVQSRTLIGVYRRHLRQLLSCCCCWPVGLDRRSSRVEVISGCLRHDSRVATVSSSPRRQVQCRIICKNHRMKSGRRLIRTVPRGRVYDTADPNARRSADND